ncbi:hypothetical protein M758_3G219800 [Ceratodon purpureus]|nr:hypothetical protein M758_3G219800 [Ceratodon purpureus]
MVSSATNAVAVVLLLQSTWWIGVLAAPLHDITVEGGERHGGGEVHWDYSDGPHGPAHWHELKPEWAVCKTGKQQSPLAVDPNDVVSKSSLGPLWYEYRLERTPATIVNEGHAVVVNWSFAHFVRNASLTHFCKTVRVYKWSFQRTKAMDI